MQPAGQDPRGTPSARNWHTTAPFADEGQSFLDNVIAGFEPIGAWNDPELCVFQRKAATDSKGRRAGFQLKAATAEVV
jgi:hypothetical protein